MITDWTLLDTILTPFGETWQSSVHYEVAKHALIGNIAVASALHLTNLCRTINNLSQSEVEQQTPATLSVLLAITIVPK